MQPIIHPHAHEFAALFEGFSQAHGVYNVEASATPGKKKGKAASLVAPVTTDLWSKHLYGKQGLGIIPINESNKCRFGAIDVDDYNLDPSSLQMKSRKLGLPLVVCRTKSGGTHLYMFTTEWIEAALMKTKLEEFASILGVGGSEVFPKQTQLLVDRGDAGSWINMPYFNGNETDRYAFNNDGMVISNIDKFLRYAQDKMVDEETLLNWTLPVKEPLGQHAPPCLNCLCSQGFPEGTRNDGLMNLGVLAILQDKDNWEKLLDQFNSAYMDPPLGTKEVIGVINSLKKKEYRYMCNRQPLQSYCNKPVCRTRKHGIGPSTGMPSMGTLTKFDSVPPIWFLDVEGKGRIELQTDDLQNPLRFQKACMEQLDCMPPISKREDWMTIVAGLLESVNTVKIPHESTPKGMLVGYLEDFVNSKSQFRLNPDREILLQGGVWIDEGYAYFRLKDFIEYLQIRRFVEFKPAKVAVIMKEIGAEHQFFNIKGKGTNCYRVPEGAIIQKSPFNVPKQSSDSPI